MKTYFCLGLACIETSLHNYQIQDALLSQARNKDKEGKPVTELTLANALLKNHNYELIDRYLCKKAVDVRVDSLKKTIKCPELNINLYYGETKDTNVVGKVVRFDYAHDNGNWLLPASQTRLVKVAKQNANYLEGEDLLEKGLTKSFVSQRSEI